MTYTAAHHQGETETFWLQFWGALMSSIFVRSVGSTKCPSVHLFKVLSVRTPFAPSAPQWSHVTPKILSQEP